MGYTGAQPAVKDILGFDPARYPAPFGAHLPHLLATDIGGFLLGSLAAVGLSRVPALLSPVGLAAIISLLGLAFGLDVVLWLRGGIRSIEIDDQRLTLYRGAVRRTILIERSEVSRIRITRFLGRRGAVVSGKGRRTARARTIRIWEDAFSRETFTRFLACLDGWNTGS